MAVVFVPPQLAWALADAVLREAKEALSGRGGVA